MLRLVFAILLFTQIIGDAAPASRRPLTLDEKIKARGVLLVDVETNQILFERNAETAYPPASTTKLMTALLVYEKTRLQGKITVAREDTRVEPSHIPLKQGETVSINDLTHALLIGSDNDSAAALARHVGGTMEEFIDMMNQRARELGCRKVSFKNPHGLPSPGQVCSASDMLKIFRAVISIPDLREICKTQAFSLRTQAGFQTIRNHNKLLGRYAGMGPAKTGWTIASRHTYAASATRNGRELHLIILNSPDKWTDAKLLFDYGFSRIPSMSM